MRSKVAIPIPKGNDEHLRHFYVGGGGGGGGGSGTLQKK